jgi:hypothetical protein
MSPLSWLFIFAAAVMVLISISCMSVGPIQRRLAKAADDRYYKRLQRMRHEARDRETSIVARHEPFLPEGQHYK